ncbi:MAG: hypothetical protein HZA88_07785 [Verrucomicrobia bacterium]|nr:hypothetical protein [Verrucomicrobiota bacterium]
MTHAITLEAPRPAPEAPTLMSRLSDWLNPILVKEVRQAVHGREFNYSFSLSLLIGLVIALHGSAYAEPGSATGKGVFTALTVCLGIVSLVVAPIGAFFALNGERIEKTFDMVTLTALSCRAIVVGKLLAQVVKLLTFFAALSPFMAMSFLLGGVDLPTILDSLLMLFLASLWVCALCLFVSTIGKSRGAAFALLGAVGAMMIPMVPGLLFVLFEGRGGGGFGFLFTASSWSASAIGLALWLVSLINLVSLTVSRIMSATDNGSTALRVGFLAQFLLVLGLLAWKHTTRGYGGLSEFVVVVASLHLVAGALFAVTEDLTLSRRVHRQLPKNRLLFCLSAMFQPGGGHGAIYTCALSGLLIAAAAMAKLPGNGISMAVGLCCYVWFFSGVVTVACRQFMPHRTTPLLLRFAVPLTVAVGSLVPIVIMLLTRDPFERSIYSGRHIFNPFYTLVEWADVVKSGWDLAVFVMGFVGLVAYLWLVILGHRANASQGRT